MGEAFPSSPLSLFKAFGFDARTLANTRQARATENVSGVGNSSVGPLTSSDDQAVDYSDIAIVIYSKGLMLNFWSLYELSAKHKLFHLNKKFDSPVIKTFSFQLPGEGKCLGHVYVVDASQF